MTPSNPAWLGGAKHFRWRPLLISIGGVALLTLLASAFVAGSRYGGTGPLGEFTLARWDEDLATQRAMIEETRGV
ncbi:MAG: hypothetical protein HW392_2022, partial [Steroidobacteraceae bacterium]|nr:hypothetical protein [Steroidobacteraceae bacterium]